MATEVEAEKIDIRTRTRLRSRERVAVEVPVNIRVNGKHVVMLFASPDLLEELTIGWLLGEGILRSVDEIQEIGISGNNVDVRTRTDVEPRVEAAREFRVVSTACASTEDFLRLLDRIERPMVKSSYQVDAELIPKMARELYRRSSIFRATGGTHSAALFCGGELVAFAEDVGRHNAVDKCLGIAAKLGVDFSKCVLVSSGRQPADIVLKAARTGIPILASIRAPLESGVAVAKKTGVTLIGFVRGSRFNVYSHPERLRLS